MMSFYSTLNQQRHRQIVIDNKKPTSLEHSTQCHDNRSFLPDTTTTSPTIECHLPVVLPSLSSSTELNSRSIVIENFKHNQNKTFPPVEKTPSFQNFSATSPLAFETTTPASGTPLSKDWQFLDDAHYDLLSHNYTKNPHSNDNDDNNNANSVSSHYDVTLTIENNLPAIMHNLCIDGHYKTTTATSSSIENDPIINLTCPLINKPQQQKQQQGYLHQQIEDVHRADNNTTTRRDTPFNVTVGETFSKTQQQQPQGNTTTRHSYSNTNIMPPATSCFPVRTTTPSSSIPRSSSAVTIKTAPKTRAVGEVRSSDMSIYNNNEQRDLIDIWSREVCTPTSPNLLEQDKPGDSIMFSESDEEREQQQQQHDNDYFQYDFPSDDGNDSYGNSSKKKCFGRMRRSATNDERMFKSTEIQPEPLPRCRSIDCSDYYTSATTSGKPTKSRSKRKMLKRSVSLGFSKFKLISSNFNLRTHKRLPDDDIMIDIKETEYQTSRRKNTFTDQTAETQATVEKILNSGKDICPSKYPLLRSLSAPETLDQDTDDYDEDISELYLPRRRAICPNLPVPAMKQLKTYLILTRLKQYCFV